jgi:uncharacterized protein YacL
VFVESIRLLVVLLLTSGGYEIGTRQDHPVLGALLGAAVGYVAGGVLGRQLGRAMGSLEAHVVDAPATEVLIGGLGGGLGALLGGLAGLPVVLAVPPQVGWPLVGLLAVLGADAGFRVFARKSTELIELAGLQVRPLVPDGTLPGGSHLIDTSAAIDGRVGVLVDQGFLVGTIAVTRFVLDELQGLADAQDSTLRRRGHRGLELLEALRSGGRVSVQVIDDDPVRVAAVDAKLIEVARRHGLPLITCDRGLASRAAVAGVSCLDPSRLSDSLKGDYLPGTTIRLPISREGKEAGQGVGYLDDGSMVVVVDAAAQIGHEIDVTLTSEVETSVGRMFFASRSGT